MEKVYKRTIYWLNTKKFCGAVAVDQDGYIFALDTAPCYRWMSKKKMRFNEVMRFLKSKNEVISCKKICEDIDPF